MSRRVIAALIAAGYARVAAAQPAPDPGSLPVSAVPGGSAPTPDPGMPAATTGGPIDPTGEVPGPAGKAVGVPTPRDPASPIRSGPAVAAPVEPGEDDLGDQGIAAELGVAGGGHLTPGGLRIAGHYLYELSDQDWFDGAASFTFGSGGAACFRDRSDAVVCNHGVSDGTGVEISVSVRRMFAPQGAFRPFARLGVGLGLVRFSDDDVSGVTVPAHGGGGVRVKIAPAIAVVAEGELTLGFGSFNRGLGSAIQFGLAVTAGAEFRLR